MLFDFVKQQWKELAKGIVGWQGWSNDGRYLYYLDSSEAGSVRQVDITNSNRLPLKNLPTTGRYGFSLALAADDSPLALRNAGTQDIYSLDWQEP